MFNMKTKVRKFETTCMWQVYLFFRPIGRLKVQKETVDEAKVYLLLRSRKIYFDIADNMSKTLKYNLHTTLFFTLSPLKLYSDGMVVVQK